MSNRFALCAVGALVLSILQGATALYSAAPLPIEGVAPLEDLVGVANTKIDVIEELLDNQAEDENDDPQAREKEFGEAVGTLACVGQAIAEHPQADPEKINGPGLRDAALSLQENEGLAERQAALANAKSALESARSGEVEHAWDELIGIDAMMQEVNHRTAKVRRTLRRSRRPEEEALEATTIAVLAVAMYADTSYCDGDEQIAQWQGFARDYQLEMSAVAAALKAEQQDDVRAHFEAAMKACNDCHAVFRD